MTVFLLDRDFIETGNIKEINLRQYQCELAKVGCEDDNNCVIIAPTNSGKTWVACKIIQVKFLYRLFHETGDETLNVPKLLSISLFPVKLFDI